MANNTYKLGPDIHLKNIFKTQVHLLRFYIRHDRSSIFSQDTSGAHHITRHHQPPQLSTTSLSVNAFQHHYYHYHEPEIQQHQQLDNIRNNINRGRAQRTMRSRAWVNTGRDNRNTRRNRNSRRRASRRQRAMQHGMTPNARARLVCPNDDR